MTPKRRNKHMVRQAKHYQPEPDIEWSLPPVKEFDFKDDKNAFDNPTISDRKVRSAPEHGTTS